MSSGPALSVVLVALVADGAAESLEAAVTSLLTQADDVDGEVIVPADDAVARVLARLSPTLLAHPRLRVVAVAGAEVEPSLLRGAGIGAARAELIAVIEDHTLPAPDWCRRIIAAHRSPAGRPFAAIGGVVEKALPDGAVGWAMFLHDYGRYMPPLPAAEARSLTSCNVSYKRDAIERVRDAWGDAFRETDVHWALLARGERLWLDPSIVVRQRRRIAAGRAVREWFAYGREFGTARARTEGRIAGLTRIAAAPALPALFAWRARAHLRRAPEHRGAFARAFPALLLLGAAWAAGEVAGAVAPRRDQPARR